MTPLEIAANVITTISIFLAGRNSVHTWWTGILGCLLFAILFYQTQLYADVTLQIFFLVTSVLGWINWLRGNHGHALSVSHADFRKFSWTVPVGLAATAAYGGILHYFTNAYAPFADSAILVFSVIAQLLLMQRRIENWPFWLIVNSIAVPLYACRGLYLTAVLYSAYWINACLSWWWWDKLARRDSVEAA